MEKQELLYLIDGVYEGDVSKKQMISAVDAYTESLTKKESFVVTNINGDVIGVADSFANALCIYKERYGDLPRFPDDHITKYETNQMHYA